MQHGWVLGEGPFSSLYLSKEEKEPALSHHGGSTPPNCLPKGPTSKIITCRFQYVSFRGHTQSIAGSKHIIFHWDYSVAFLKLGVGKSEIPGSYTKVNRNFEGNDA